MKQFVKKDEGYVTSETAKLIIWTNLKTKNEVGMIKDRFEESERSVDG